MDRPTLGTCALEIDSVYQTYQSQKPSCLPLEPVIFPRLGKETCPPALNSPLEAKERWTPKGR